ncbi:hypothetical protein [Methylobacterium sp. A54F]
MNLYTSRPTHPGRTAAERKILDAIGCGDFNPRMHPKVRDRLLEAGLVVQCSERLIGQGWSAVRLPEYAMPIPVHMQWCSAVAATDEEMAEFVKSYKTR